MFRALLYPSSGARGYMCVITAYGVQCLVAGCRRSGAGQHTSVEIMRVGVVLLIGGH